MSDISGAGVCEQSYMGDGTKCGSFEKKLYLLLIANPPLQFLELVFKYIQPVCTFLFFPGWLDYCLGLFSLSIRGLIV